jgi:AMP phosphorylase
MESVISLKVKIINILANYPVALLNSKNAELLGAYPLSRLEVKDHRLKTTCILDISDQYVDVNHIGIFEDLANSLGLKPEEELKVSLLPFPKSLEYILKKINNNVLLKDEIYTIIDDVKHNKILETELSAFVTALYINGLNIEETGFLCNAMIDIGDRLSFGKKEILDKHSIGGINGRVSMVIVPIIASLGYYIPKTSSRSISSAAGTADAMEVLAPVSFKVDEIKHMIDQVKGVITWEGEVDISPVDNTFIRIEHSLHINPEGLMIASILSKKKATGVTYLVIDIPIGSNVKVKDKEQGQRLAKKFILIGRSLGIKTKALLTDGEEPCGRAFGPSLEAREVLRLLEGKHFDNLGNKSCEIAGALLELVGGAQEGTGYKVAKETILSGQALSKFKEIIKIQGGNIFSSEQIKEAQYKTQVLSEENGKIDKLHVGYFTTIAQIAGAPLDKQAGVLLFKEVGDNVKKGTLLYEVHSNSQDKLNQALEFIKENNPVTFEKIVLEEYS